ncbi:MAG TPA: Hsp20/alpha crystallin family protein [Roseiflexaceae bacterium]
MSAHQRSAIRIVAIRQPFALFEPRPWRPPMNIYETEQGIQIVAELAGIALDDLQVYVHPTSVQIEGTRRLEAPAGLSRIQRMEIASGPFQIEVPLATPIDPDRAGAQYEDGLLDIWLPFAHQPNQRVVVIRLGEGGAR